MKPPEAYSDSRLVSCTMGKTIEGFEPIVLSSPRTWNRQMLITACMPTWNVDECFFINLEDIDNKAVKHHVLWKFSGDSMYIINLQVQCEMSATNADELRIRNWKFL